MMKAQDFDHILIYHRTTKVHLNWLPLEHVFEMINYLLNSFFVFRVLEYQFD